MIEVEKKFLLENPDDERRLLDGAMFMHEGKHRDTYWDNETYTLTTKNKWLRQRDGVWELKNPDGLDAMAKEQLGSRYTEITAERELTTELEISAAIGMDPKKSLEENLLAHGYKPFCSFETTRRAYTKNGFTIDIDHVDFGYTVIEIEKLVNESKDVEKIMNDIHQFGKQHGLQIVPLYGKAMQWLQIHNKPHFDAVRQALIPYR